MESPFKFKSVSEEQAERIYRDNPSLKNKGSDDFCPTCRKKMSYVWDGKTVKCDCQDQLSLHKHYLKSGIGETYQRVSWSDYNGDPLAKGIADDYLENHEKMVSNGIGILFTGNFGVGKTMVTTLLLKDLMWLGYDVFSTTFTNMIDMYTSGWNSPEDKKYFHQKLKGSDVLLLDDLGKEFLTKNNLAESTFDSVLRTRVQNGKPTFLTTNLRAREMGGVYGHAVLSLLKETSFEHDFDGPDYRKVVNSRKIDEIRSGETRPIF